MRYLVALLALSAGEPETKPDYTEFSRLIHKTAVKQMPKEIVDTSGWGQTIEIPGNLRLMKLRQLIKVGDHLEAPHGTWRKFKGKIEDPDKNLKIVVKDFKKQDDKTYRVVVDVDAIVLVHGEVQQWQKGLMLIGSELTADANFTATIVCDVGATLNFKKFPPELTIDPKITDLGLNLVDFQVRGGPILTGDKGRAIANDIKDLMRQAVKASEGMVKDEANRAIAEALKDGKGTISAGSILSALPPPKISKDK